MLCGERPIAFASHSLTQVERNYAQIHKDALAIVWAIWKAIYPGNRS